MDLMIATGYVHDRIKTALQPLLVASLFLTLGPIFSVSAHATWSIVAVDPETGEVGLGAATCSLGVHFIADAVPGTGVVVAQAATSFKGRNQARDWMKEGIGANEILNRLSDPTFYDGWFDPDFDDLQYGVATLSDGSQVGFTGGDNLIPWFGGTTGATYSVQGNILRGKNVVIATASAFEKREDGNCRLTIGERLLRALEAGRDAGGDKRCPAGRPAHSAILLIARMLENDGEGSATMVRHVTPKEISLARGIYHSLFPYHPDENAEEPVTHLRRKYEASGGRRCQAKAI
jgi:uncharacterized Ntn-hydrolase superfamily protein